MPEQVQTGLLLDPLYKRHVTGQRHPECPERYDAVTVALEKAELTAKMPRIEVRVATEDEIALCHARSYIQLAKREITAGVRDLSTGDTTVCPASYEVAVRAVGGVLNGVDQVMAGKVKNAFCAVRPPGHHATPERGMGFCVFNNVAMAARYAQRRHHAERVLIADWDVHHGNGTQDVFYSDGSVLFLSTHQHPWYPGTGLHNETGEGAGAGKILNYPLPAGSGRDEILKVFQKQLQDAADKFKPDFVIISAGFDSRVGDPLGRFRLTDEDFRDLTRVMMAIAEKHARNRLLSVLEGGYSLNGLADGVTAHVRALTGA